MDLLRATLREEKAAASSEAINNMYQVFDLEVGKANFDELMKNAGITIHRNKRAQEFVRQQRKVLDLRLRNCTISRDRYIEKVRALAKKHRQLGVQLELLEKRRFQEESLRSATPTHFDTGIVAALQRLVFSVPKGPRKAKIQSHMWRSAINTYALKAPASMEHSSFYYWDIVAGQYLFRRDMVCAHIVPRSLDNAMVDFVCGDGSSLDLDNWMNALCLQKPVERALDNGDIVIMPLDPAENPAMTFVLRLTTKDIINSIAYVTTVGKFVEFRELDGRILQWKNDVRPKRQFLYFKWIQSLVVKQHSAPERLLDCFDDLKTKQAWMTVGPWLRKSALLQLARIPGCLDESEIDAILGTIAKSDLDGADSRSIRQITGHRILSTAQDAATTEDEEEEDSDDSIYEFQYNTEDEPEPTPNYAESIRGPVSIFDDSDMEDDIGRDVEE